MVLISHLVLHPLHTAIKNFFAYFGYFIPCFKEKSRGLISNQTSTFSKLNAMNIQDNYSFITIPLNMNVIGENSIGLLILERTIFMLGSYFLNPFGYFKTLRSTCQSSFTCFPSPVPMRRIPSDRR